MNMGGQRMDGGYGWNLKGGLEECWTRQRRKGALHSAAFVFGVAFFTARKAVTDRRDIPTLSCCLSVVTE